MACARRVDQTRPIRRVCRGDLESAGVAARNCHYCRNSKRPHGCRRGPYPAQGRTIEPPELNTIPAGTDERTRLVGTTRFFRTTFPCLCRLEVFGRLLRPCAPCRRCTAATRCPGRPGKSVELGTARVFFYRQRPTEIPDPD